jgi:hypothetical protein
LVLGHRRRCIEKDTNDKTNDTGDDTFFLH